MALLEDQSKELSRYGNTWLWYGSDEPCNHKLCQEWSFDALQSALGFNRASNDTHCEIRFTDLRASVENESTSWSGLSHNVCFTHGFRVYTLLLLCSETDSPCTVALARVYRFSLDPTCQCFACVYSSSTLVLLQKLPVTSYGLTYPENIFPSAKTWNF